MAAHSHKSAKIEFARLSGAESSSKKAFAADRAEIYGGNETVSARCSLQSRLRAPYNKKVLPITQTAGKTKERRQGVGPGAAGLGALHSVREQKPIADVDVSF